VMSAESNFFFFSERHYEADLLIQRRWAYQSLQWRPSYLPRPITTGNAQSASNREIEIWRSALGGHCHLGPEESWGEQPSHVSKCFWLWSVTTCINITLNILGHLRFLPNRPSWK
jgi:hypothetical protein